VEALRQPLRQRFADGALACQDVADDLLAFSVSPSAELLLLSSFSLSCTQEKIGMAAGGVFLFARSFSSLYRWLSLSTERQRDENISAYLWREEQGVRRRTRTALPECRGVMNEERRKILPSS
jgi:hypothetical protein